MPDPAVLACRPRDLDLDDPMDAQIARETFVYEGSIDGTCAPCGAPVHVGPKAIALLIQQPDAQIVCFRCVVALMAMGVDADIRNLGNRQRRPPG